MSSIKNAYECFECLNARMYVLVGYDAVEDWKSKPTTNLTMAMGEVEVFLNKFLDYFMAQQ